MNFSFWPFLWFGLPGRLLIRCPEGKPESLGDFNSRLFKNLLMPLAFSLTTHPPLIKGVNFTPFIKGVWVVREKAL